ncbi:hypothetical protein [Thalassococcus sp. S3]|uniref:hypothetical protein n=1 Tax=Thalassococcus sp. S3 TaxID=2017482 RepID=UPI0010246B2A|nr:hypothetical protein [Thalassococcus sp. S3]QBF31530.1 hypothetical protein CFI11_09920 [Thalassococcus sp. S3]
MTEPLTAKEIAVRAQRAVRRVDTYGQRGLTLVTLEEIEALVLIAVLSGLVADAPKEETP